MDLNLEEEKLAINTVIFDLDGTLLDTITDIANAVNHALLKNNLPTHDVNTVKTFVGNGYNVMINKACPQGTTDEIFNKVLSDFITYYSLHNNDSTAPYDGILELLETLKSHGYKTGILSNKEDSATKKLSAETFEDRIDYARGFGTDLPPKPAPDGLFHVALALGSDLSEVAFVGDSDVDIQTGKNAKVFTIGVSWGFRTREDLVKNGADFIADEVSDILKGLVSNG